MVFFLCNNEFEQYLSLMLEIQQKFNQKLLFLYFISFYVSFKSFLLTESIFSEKLLLTLKKIFHIIKLSQMLIKNHKSEKGEL